MSQVENFDSWAIVELMGHVRMAGRLTEEERFGGKMGRLDVPKDDGFVTTYFTAGSVYRIVPTTEEIARSVASHNQPRPVSLYELPKPAAKMADDEVIDPSYDPEEDEDPELEDAMERFARDLD
jgi:hypothetical protein